MNCTCPRLEVSASISIVQHTPDCSKNKNKASFGVRKYKLRGAPIEYQPQEIRVLSDIEGEVAENPILKDQLYIAKLGSDEAPPERGKSYDSISGFGEWMRHQDILGKKLGFEPGLEKVLRVLDKCQTCHERPVRRGLNDQLIPNSPLCEECYAVHLKENRTRLAHEYAPKKAVIDHRRYLLSRRVICPRCNVNPRNLDAGERMCSDCRKIPRSDTAS